MHVGTLALDRPLLNGSGVVDVISVDEDWNLPDAAVIKLGAFVTKTLTRDARAGNPRPWAEAIGPGTLINAVGLANPGIDAANREWTGLADRLAMPVIASIGGRVEDLPELAQLVTTAGWADALELNLSCPNVDGGLVAADPIAAGAAVAAVRAATHLPIFAKLTPACGAPAQVARAVEAAGADAVTCGNTMPIRAAAPDGTPLLGAGFHGGMSGVGLHLIALRLVAEVAAAVAVPVVGLGGIDGEAAAQRMFDAGADILAVGTGAVLDPGLIARLAAMLQ